MTARQPLLSVLIPTLIERREQFARMAAAIDNQIRSYGLEDEVEVLDLCDNRTLPVGEKRNSLLDRATGLFVAFVDDDDRLSEDYLVRICDAIRSNPDIDCIGLKLCITFAGAHPRTLIHSLRYQEYFSKDGVYFRPPCHLNPIRRSIARRYRFEPVNYSEDIDWAMRLCRDGALQREHYIDATLYYYLSRRRYSYQWLLDRTEPVRHALGIRLANRIRMKNRFLSLFSSASRGTH
jgi:Glycosyltransferases, probably involved in cell wall biogenesis